MSMFLPTALWFAVIFTVVATIIRIGLLRAPDQKEDESVAAWATSHVLFAVLTFVTTFLVTLLSLYEGTPAHAGTVYGITWIFGPIFYSLLVLFVLYCGPAIVLYFAGNEESLRFDHVAASGIATLLGYGVPTVLLLLVVMFSSFFSTIGWWGPKQQYVNYAHIITGARPAPGATTTLPATDPTHLVLVTREIAYYEGQQAISSTGQNLGSRFHFEESDYTLQSVDGHLYWVAPLDYNNLPGQINYYDTPGYVMVDAENPNNAAQLVTKDMAGHAIHIHYTPAASFDRNLVRHVYEAGYQTCYLEDPTLEIDDGLDPWYTITCAENINGFNGMTITSVLLVNPDTGAVHAYAPGKQPSWVDRIVPSDEAKLYVEKWARFSSAPWWNPSGTGEMKVPDAIDSADELPLVYNSVDHAVWFVPLTSNNNSDTSSVGFVLYDTQSLKGTFYPQGGITIGDPVTAAFEKAPGNIRNYAVSQPVLYNLYGEPTWLVTYEQDTGFGSSFQAVGLVDALHLNGANVVMTATIGQALSTYQSQLLAAVGTNNQHGTAASNEKTLTGKLLRITTTQTSAGTIFHYLIAGSTHVFDAPANLAATYPNLLVAEVGDNVTVTYVDTQQVEVPIASFADLTVVQLTVPATTPTH